MIKEIFAVMQFRMLVYVKTMSEYKDEAEAQSVCDTLNLPYDIYNRWERKKETFVKNHILYKPFQDSLDIISTEFRKISSDYSESAMKEREGLYTKELLIYKEMEPIVLKLEKEWETNNPPPPIDDEWIYYHVVETVPGGKYEPYVTTTLKF